jgi:hypothetical protein
MIATVEPASEHVAGEMSATLTRPGFTASTTVIISGSPYANVTLGTESLTSVTPLLRRDGALDRFRFQDLLTRWASILVQLAERHLRCRRRQPARLRRAAPLSAALLAGPPLGGMPLATGALLHATAGGMPAERTSPRAWPLLPPRSGVACQGGGCAASCAMPARFCAASRPDCHCYRALADAPIDPCTCGLLCLR